MDAVHADAPSNAAYSPSGAVIPHVSGTAPVAQSYCHTQTHTHCWPRLKRRRRWRDKRGELLEGKLRQAGKEPGRKLELPQLELQLRLCRGSTLQVAFFYLDSSSLLSSTSPLPLSFFTLAFLLHICLNFILALLFRSALSPYFTLAGLHLCLILQLRLPLVFLVVLVAVILHIILYFPSSPSSPHAALPPPSTDSHHRL